MADTFDVEGPVLAEVFAVYADEGGPHLTGPCGPAAWYIEVAAGDDPMQVAGDVVGRVIGPPLLLHSTSWRRDRTGVVLSFVAVLDPARATELDSVAIGRAELARGGATTAATAIATNQVLEHGLRHLAWLVKDDAVVRDTLSPQWHAALAGYVPEPFRHLAVTTPDPAS